MKVVFRADASAAIGGGHVMRCLTLADILIKNGGQCVFLSAPGSEDIVPALKEDRYNLARAAILDLWADVLVVDHYALDAGFESDCRPWAKKIMVIDDLADRRHDCDLLMDQTLRRDVRDYTHLVSRKCRILTGPEYALLRPQFAEKRVHSLKSRRHENGALKKILLSFGTVDSENATSFALNEFSNTANAYDIDVVLGKSAPHIAAVERLANSINQNGHQEVVLHVAVKDMAKLMAEADICIGASGTTSWERCCLGLPAIVIEQADNQAKIARELEKAGAVIFLGSQAALKPGAIVKTIDDLTNNPQKLIDMSASAAAVCDGLGAQRLYDILAKGI